MLDTERHFTIGRYPGLDLEWADVMPVLAGERLIGRVAPRMDRRRGELVVEGAFAEEGSAGSMADRSVAAAIESLASFAGAGSVRYAGPAAVGVS